MTRTLVVIAASLALSLPTALAAPPEGKGKPESPGKSAAAPGQSADKNAAKACKAERATMGVEAFKTKYGTNANKANAFGKCVSGKSKAKGEDDAEAETQEARENAAKKCKAERENMGLEAFRNKYGTNANKANALGKCVSKLAKEKGSTD
jgi:ribosomal protein S24E